MIIFPAYVYSSDVDIMSFSFSFDTITISIPSRGIYDETIFRKNNRVLVVRLQDEVNSTFLWACMKAMKMGLEGLLIQNSALTIPSVTRTFTGKNMLWPIT